MKINRGLLILIFVALAFVSIASVAAADANDTAVAVDDQSDDLAEIETQDDAIASSDENILSDPDDGTFTSLQNKINSGSTISLENDYLYDEGFSTSGITINKKVTINGNNKVIDANSKSRIFNIEESGELIINHVIFKGGSAGDNGGAINVVGTMEITDCTFENCVAENGGAIYCSNIKDSKLTVNSVTFKSCTARTLGGAIYGPYDAGYTITLSHFEDCRAVDGGAIFLQSHDMTVSSCDFTNCVASESGGAIYVQMLFQNVQISGCNFKDCYKSGNPGESTRDNAVAWGSGASVTQSACTYKDSTSVEASPVTTTYNLDDYLVITLKDRTGKGIKNADLTIDFNGTMTCATDSNGQVNISTKGLTPGNYTAKITFNGKDDYDKSNATADVTVNKDSTLLDASAVTTNYNTNKDLVITLKDSQGNALSGYSITVDLNGAKAYTTDKNGQVKIAVGSLVPKTYTAKITFKGNDNYTDAAKDVKVTVNKLKSKITAKNKKFKKSKKTKKYQITLKDANKKAIKKVKVTLKVKGKTYKATTNNKGKATFKITKLTKKGKHKATITFKGNSYYKKATKKVKITVK